MTSLPPNTPDAPPGVPGADTPRPDPGTPTSRALAWVVAIVAALLVIGVQRVPDATFKAWLGIAEPEEQTGPPPPQVDFALDLSARMFIKMAGNPAFEQTLQGGMLGAEAQLKPYEVGLGNRIVIAITVADIEGPERGTEILDSIELGLERLGLEDDERAAFNQDIDDFRAVLAGGQAAIDDDSRQRLEDRYGFFANVALTESLGAGHTDYDALRAGGLRIVLGLTFGMLLAGTALLAGAVLLILALVWALSGKLRPRFQPPPAGGSVYLETYAVLAIGLLVVWVGGTVLAARFPIVATLVIPMQLLLVFSVLWPLVRGERFGRWKSALGLVAPRGVLREVGAGFVMYVAAFPLFIGGALLAVAISFIIELLNPSGPTDAAPPIDSGIQEMLAQGGWGTIALVLLLGVVWAPLVEELVMRGALYRHLRSSVGWIIAGLSTALIFSLMHGYPLPMMIPLVALGIAFAAMRELRGSLVAPITAHFLHNASLMTFQIIVFRPLFA